MIPGIFQFLEYIAVFDPEKGPDYRESSIIYRGWHIILTAQQTIRTIPPLFLDDL